MKDLLTTVVGLGVIGVSAQSTSNASTLPHPTTPTLAPIYETIYFDDCTSAPTPVPSSVTPITVTDTTTKTYCPLCTETGTTPPAAPYTTTYETVYSVFCSTGGLTASTYTVTAPCSETGLPRPSTYIPPGFTVTSTVCTVCGPAPVTATLTIPTSCISPAVAPTTPPAAAVPTLPAAPGFNPVPAPQPAHYETNATTPLASPPVVSSAPSTSPIVAFEGGATRMSMSVEMFVGAMGLVGVVAFAL